MVDKLVSVIKGEHDSDPLSLTESNVLQLMSSDLPALLSRHSDLASVLCPVLSANPDLIPQALTHLSAHPRVTHDLLSAFKRSSVKLNGDTERLYLEGLLEGWASGTCEPDEVMNHLDSKCEDMGVYESAVLCSKYGYEPGTVYLLSKTRSDRVLIEAYKAYNPADHNMERVRQELLGIADGGVRRDVLGALVKMWGDAADEDEKEDVEDDIAECLEGNDNEVEPVTMVKVLSEGGGGMPLKVGLEWIANILDHDQEEIERLEGEIRSYEEQVRVLEVEIDKIGGRGTRRGGKMLDFEELIEEIDVEDNGRMDHVLGDEKEKVVEAFWRDVNNEKNDRFKAVSKYYRVVPIP